MFSRFGLTSLVVCLALAAGATAAQAQSPTTISSESTNSEEAFSSTATVSFTDGGPGPTGEVYFFVFGPDDPTCTDSPVSGYEAYLDAEFKARVHEEPLQTPGTYQVVASYNNGDENYSPSEGVCGDDPVVVERRPRFLLRTDLGEESGREEVTLGESLQLEGELRDTNDPTGTATFNLYGPDEQGEPCTSTPEQSKVVEVRDSYVSADLSPQAAGTYHASAVYSGDANDGPLTSECIEFTVVEPPEATLAPSSLVFASQPVGTIGRSQEITLTNTGGAWLADFGVSVTNNDEFLISSDTCSTRSALRVDESCTIRIRFTPQEIGERTGTLTVTSNDPNGPATASLSGTGGPPSAAGTDGTDGAAGTNGTNGTNGADGTAGPAGAAGAAGVAGQPGTAGAPGPAGGRGPSAFSRLLGLFCSRVKRTCRVAITLGGRDRLIVAKLTRVRGSTRTAKSVSPGGVLLDSRGRAIRLAPGRYRITVRIARGSNRTSTRIYNLKVVV